MSALDDLMEALREREAKLREEMGAERYDTERDYWRGLWLYGHGVRPGKYHQVNLQSGDIDIWLVGMTCMHCGEVVV